MRMKYGYARTGTAHQRTTLQLAALLERMSGLDAKEPVLNYRRGAELDRAVILCTALSISP
jgi:hypothetical protein